MLGLNLNLLNESQILLRLKPPSRSDAIALQYNCAWKWWLMVALLQLGGPIPNITKVCKCDDATMVDYTHNLSATLRFYLKPAEVWKGFEFGWFTATNNPPHPYNYSEFRYWQNENFLMHYNWYHRKSADRVDTLMQGFWDFKSKF